MKIFIFLLGIATLFSCTENNHPLSYVDPFIGTGGHGLLFQVQRFHKGAGNKSWIFSDEILIE